MDTYRLSPEAKDDLVRIYNYGIKQFGQQQAEIYIAELLAAIERLTKNPGHFQSVDEIVPGYRRCVHKADTIYFRLKKNTVEIMAVVGRQDWRR
nr:type II toxin-antitoxin system RelE/ParE family toxin [Allomuricauda sp.]